MSLGSFSASGESARIQDKTLTGCMLLTMLKQSTPTDTRRTAWPQNFRGLSVSTLRPAAQKPSADRKNQSQSSPPADFSKLRITTAQEKKSQKPRSPTSITNIICPENKSILSEISAVPESPRAPMASDVLDTPHLPDSPFSSMASSISETSHIPMAPIPETPHDPEPFSAAKARHTNKLGKIVCKKCNRLLDRARRCCGTYSVALCIRVEHIPEAYRPRVGCSGAIRAHFPSFAKASRYRLFLSHQMRKKRKLRFLVECEDSDSDEDSRKRQRNDSMNGNESMNEFFTINSRINNSIADAKTQLTGYSKLYHPPNLTPAFSYTCSVSSTVTRSVSSTVTRHFNQQSALRYRMAPHGLPPHIAGLDQDLLATPPD